jgi:glucokinase
LTVLAVDLGGTHMRCAAVADNGAVTNRVELSTPHDGADTSALVALMRGVAGNVTGCTSAVVGVPGRVDYRAGQLEQAPNLPERWVAQLTEHALSSDVGMPVALANDADLAAVGESYTGAGREFSDVAYLTISTGIGAGVVLGGLLVHGRHSLAEVGHAIIDVTRWRAGQACTLESLASGTALGRQAAAAHLGPTGKEVVDAVRAGNADARRIWDDLVLTIAVGVINLVWTFTPEVVVIGGGLGLVGDVLLDPLRAAVAPHDPTKVSIVAAALGDDAALAGAASWGRAFVPEHAGRR